MKKLIAACAAVALISAFVCCACASPATVMTGDQAMAEMRAGYRDSSLIVSGECVRLHENADGVICSDVEISEVIAGSASIGDTIHCLSSDMWVDADYMLYLKSAGDVDHAEDDGNYSIVKSLEIADESVSLSGVTIKYADLKRDIRDLSSVISSPASYYYYSDLASLCEAAEEIFIGTVSYEPDMADTNFRVAENGTTVEYTIPASLARITAFGSVKGGLKYGDTIRLVYAPATSADLIDAATLTSVSYNETNAPRLEPGRTYMFFLMHSPDDKQEYRFCVNPIQGYVAISEETLYVPGVNAALKPYIKLGELVTDIKAELS